jgi:hypothetical protein
VRMTCAIAASSAAVIGRSTKSVGVFKRR